MYSLRAFARNLGVNHSTLSQFMRGKRPLTRRTIEQLGARLKLSAGEIARFTSSLQRPAEPDGTIREASLLAHDTACAIAQWEHHAILELLKLPEFRPDSRWIARVLDLTVDEVNMSLQRLLRLEMLEMVSRDKWIDRSGDESQSQRAFAFAALRKMLERFERMTRIRSDKRHRKVYKGRKGAKQLM